MEVKTIGIASDRPANLQPYTLEEVINKLNNE
jgi:hypothetical protein